MGWELKWAAGRAASFMRRVLLIEQKIGSILWQNLSAETICPFEIGINNLDLADGGSEDSEHER